jgi:hypothetical protein
MGGGHGWTRQRHGARRAKDPMAVLPEPAGRRVVRLAFGSLWWVDGLLQLQSAMPAAAATSVVWIEVGIGLLLLPAPRGGWSTAAGPGPAASFSVLLASPVNEVLTR